MGRVEFHLTFRHSRRFEGAPSRIFVFREVFASTIFMKPTQRQEMSRAPRRRGALKISPKPRRVRREKREAERPKGAKRLMPCWPPFFALIWHDPPYDTEAQKARTKKPGTGSRKNGDANKPVVAIIRHPRKKGKSRIKE